MSTTSMDPRTMPPLFLVLLMTFVACLQADGFADTADKVSGTPAQHQTDPSWISISSATLPTKLPTTRRHHDHNHHHHDNDDHGDDKAATVDKRFMRFGTHSGPLPPPPPPMEDCFWNCNCSCDSRCSTVEDYQMWVPKTNRPSNC